MEVVDSNPVSSTFQQCNALHIMQPPFTYVNVVGRLTSQKHGDTIKWDTMFVSWLVTVISYWFTSISQWERANELLNPNSTDIGKYHHRCIRQTAYLSHAPCRKTGHFRLVQIISAIECLCCTGPCAKLLTYFMLFITIITNNYFYCIDVVIP